MEKTEESIDEVRIVICPGKVDKVFENYVFIPIENAGFIAIKHVLKIKDDTYEKHPWALDLPSRIYFSSEKGIGVKGALVHLLNI